jgi:hypothetical protein
MEKIVYSWLNEEKTALLCTYLVDNWTWDDFHSAFQVQKTMIDSVTHPKVHIVVDASKSRMIPKGGSLLSGVRKLTDLKHPRQGHTIIVGAKGLVAAIASAVTKMLGAHRQELHLVNTMEQAHMVIDHLTKPVQQKTG